LILGTAKRDEIWYALVTDEREQLAACSFSDSEKAAKESAISSLPKAFRRKVEPAAANARLVDALHQIYLGRDCDNFPSTVFFTRSDFERNVYRNAMKIPRGMVTTYGKLAESVGSRRASRAVGNAMAKNPLPLIMPCHRVVRSTLQIGNYGAAGAKRSEGARVKRKLLIREGVQFDGETVLESCVWKPSVG
jgi:O-6-methylguanine DNA methyltransferase